MEIEHLKIPLSTADVDSINGLLKQLDPKALLQSRERLETILARADGGGIWIVRDDRGSIFAMASMFVVTTLQKKTGIIEDAVVDEASRGKGIGSALIDTLIARARELDLDRVELTSSPFREAANILYQKKGFKRRETNCYVLNLL